MFLTNCSCYQNSEIIDNVFFFEDSLATLIIFICDNYKLFKTLLNPERYLSIDMPFLHKKAMARFRCSSHKLKIEVGRHQNIERENRFCIFCQNIENRYILEDEYHVFFKCPRYLDLRQHLLYSWYSGGNDMLNFLIFCKMKNL